MPEKVRAMAIVTYDDFVGIDDIDSSLKGICISIWRRLAADLGFDDYLIPISQWPRMLDILEHNEADVSVQRLEQLFLDVANITK